MTALEVPRYIREASKSSNWFSIRLSSYLTVDFLLSTRSSATAEKQRVSSACLPRLANWSCNAQNTAESQRFYYFWHSNAL